MIDELRKIGLSDLEAGCYMVLHEEPNITGYEVAKQVSISRTNVYAALRSLTEKGMCRVIEAEPVLYDVVPIDQLIRLLKSDFEQTAETLLNQTSLRHAHQRPFTTGRVKQLTEMYGGHYESIIRSYRGILG